MKIREITEAASAGATSSGNFATLATPIQSNQKLKTDKNGIPVAPQKLNPNGTVKNALDVDDNVMGNVIKRVQSA
jgi:hypothetical protein